MWQSFFPYANWINIIHLDIVSRPQRYRKSCMRQSGIMLRRRKKKTPHEWSRFHNDTAINKFMIVSRGKKKCYNLTKKIFIDTKKKQKEAFRFLLVFSHSISFWTQKKFMQLTLSTELCNFSFNSLSLTHQLTK